MSSSQFFPKETAEKETIEKVEIPFVPSQVEISDLKPLEQETGEKVKKNKYVIQHKTPPHSPSHSPVHSLRGSLSVSPSTSTTETPFTKIPTGEDVAKAFERKNKLDVSPIHSQNVSPTGSGSSSQSSSPNSSQSSSPNLSPVISRKTHSSSKRISEFRVDSKENIEFEANIEPSKGEHISKKLLNTEFSVIQFGDEDQQEEYAIYHGNRKGKVVGKGQFGSLKIAQNTKTGDWYVLKVQTINPDNPSEDIKIKSREWEILKELGLSTAGEIPIKHKVTSPKNEGESSQTSKETVQQHYLLMKLAPGFSMEELLKSEEELSSSPDIISPLITSLQRLKFAFKTIEAAEELHNKQIVHRDIKPANIVLSPENDTLQIVDLGSARKFNRDLAYVGEKKGTPEFAAPEVQHKPDDDKAVTFDEATELYTVGITLIKLFRLHPIPDTFDSVEMLIKELENTIGESQSQSNIAEKVDIENKEEEKEEEEEKNKEEEYEDEMIEDKIIPTDDDNFMFNATINDVGHDHIILKQIHEALSKIIDEDPKKRGTFAEAKKAFSNIIDSYQKQIKTDINMGIIDASEYMESNQEDRKNIVKELVKSLSKNPSYQQIVIVDSKHRDPKNYAQLKRDLENELRTSYRPAIKNKLTRVLKELINEKIEDLEEGNDPNKDAKIEKLSKILKNPTPFIEPLLDKLKIPAKKTLILNEYYIKPSTLDNDNLAMELKKHLDKDVNYRFTILNPQIKPILESPSPR